MLSDKKQKSIWRPDELNLGDMNDIFTILNTQQKGNYCSPKGFEFDTVYHDSYN